MAPLVALLAHEKIIEARSVSQINVFESNQMFAQTEGVIPAPETGHAIKIGIDEAIKCRKTGEEKNIIINFSGHGLLDLQGYDDFLEGKLEKD
jgi:tryptophan synthase beta chain